MHYIKIGFYKDLLLLLLWKLTTQKSTREKKLYIHIYVCTYTHRHTKLITFFSQFIKFLKSFIQLLFGNKNDMPPNVKISSKALYFLIKDANFNTYYNVLLIT